MSKRKGIAAERELLHKFWKIGDCVALRAPASGAMKYPCPDLLVGNAKRRLAIECKVNKGTRQYITKEQIEHLEQFSSIFAAEAWVAIKFDDWYFIPKENLDMTQKHFVISLERAKLLGFSFEEVTQHLRSELA
ncbi:Holliday junction resolvase [Candidatus Woesearchaeota archaeon]|jgi:Holliday junction resolvase|nr:MAG: Holliday junction resolvase [Candidatus Woesearchaeota archaeon]